jgi:hypothetical protein
MNDFDTIYQCLQQATSPESVFGVLGGNAEESPPSTLSPVGTPNTPRPKSAPSECCPSVSAITALVRVGIAKSAIRHLWTDGVIANRQRQTSIPRLRRATARRFVRCLRGARPKAATAADKGGASSQQQRPDAERSAGHPPPATRTTRACQSLSNLHGYVYLPDAHNTPRQCNVLNVFENGRTLGQQPITPTGVPVKRVLWVLHDVLLLLDAVHGLGLVHGAVLPAHIWLAQNEQQVVLLDWCYSVEIGKPLLALSPTAHALYPPEVAAKLPATPATDVFLAVRSIQTLLAEQSIPKPLAAFFTACLLPAPHRRVPTAWEALSSLREITQRLYGGLPFRPTTTWQN